MKLNEICDAYGREGPTDLETYYGTFGAIADDTQMTLFTVEGLLRATVRGGERGIASFDGMLDRAYRRWLGTQGEQLPADDRKSFSYVASPIKPRRSAAKS